MKIIMVLSILWANSLFSAETNNKAICSLFYSKKVIKIATAHSVNDKNRHCTVSCMLTLRCPSVDVLSAGVLKEVKDLFGPGNAEMADLKADVLGIDIATAGAARTDLQCLSMCDLYYTP